MFGDKESNFFMKFDCIPQFLLLGVAQIFVGSKSVMFVCQMSQGLLCAYPFAYVVVVMNSTCIHHEGSLGPNIYMYRY